MDDDTPLTWVAIVIWELVSLFFVTVAFFGFVVLVVLQVGG